MSEEMYVAMAVHYPKGPKEQAVMMEEMKQLAEVESKHKGFKHLIVAELEDMGIIIPFTIWESREDMMAARMDVAKYLSTFDFKTNQEGPTRAGGTPIANGSKLTTFKIVPVIHLKQARETLQISPRSSNGIIKEGAMWRHGER